MGMLIKSYPPEASTIKNIEDSWALLKTEDGQKRWTRCQQKKVFVSHQHSAKVWRLPSRLDEGHWGPSQRERATPSWDWWLRTPGILSLPQSIKLVFLLNVGSTNSGDVFIAREQEGNHFTLAVCEIDKESIVYCDSLGWKIPNGLLSMINRYTNIVFEKEYESIVESHVSDQTAASGIQRRKKPR